MRRGLGVAFAVLISSCSVKSDPKDQCPENKADRFVAERAIAEKASGCTAHDQCVFLYKSACNGSVVYNANQVTAAMLEAYQQANVRIAETCPLVPIPSLSCDAQAPQSPVCNADGQCIAR